MRGIGTRQRNSENFFTSPRQRRRPSVHPSVPGVYFPRQPLPFVPLLRRRARTHRDLPRLSTSVYTTYARVRGCRRVRETNSILAVVGLYAVTTGFAWRTWRGRRPNRVRPDCLKNSRFFYPYPIRTLTTRLLGYLPTRRRGNGHKHRFVEYK